MRTPRTRAVLWLPLLLLLVPGAAAHGDVPSLVGPWTLEPGERLVVDRPVHWHRALGQLSADGLITVTIHGDVVAGPGRSLTVNHLIQCCDDAWTDVSFVVENVDDRAVRIDGSVAVLHDNMAVLAADAEPGGWWQTLVIVAFIIAVPASVARRSPMPADAHWLRRARWAHGGVWAAAAATALIGMVPYKTGPLVGSLAATAPFPAGFGAFLNMHALVMLGFMAAWGTAYALWAGARRRGAAGRLDGYLFAAGPLLVGASMLLELGGGWISLAMGVLPAAAILLDTLGPAGHPDPAARADA